MRHASIAFLSLLCVCVLPESLRAESADPTLVKWGTEILDAIQSDFYLPSRSLYSLSIHEKGKPHPAWIWDASIQLGALDAAARVEPDKYLPRVRSYARAVRAYRTLNHNLPGLDVNPPPKTPDRYYDDNAWICMSLLDSYELTHDPDNLRLALDSFHFVMSGGDDVLGGGLYWHEDRKNAKHACTCGPGMIDALKLYRITGEQKYLTTALSLYNWTRGHLQDRDGLVFDAIDVPSGQIHPAKFTYNSATLLNASCRLYEITHDRKYLDEAERIAAAAERRFVRPSDGLITGSGKLGVKLIEAYLELAKIDHNEHWRDVVGRCLIALHTHRNAQGWYPQDWEKELPVSDPVRLIDQSAAARAYWIAAAEGVRIPTP